MLIEGHGFFSNGGNGLLDLLDVLLYLGNTHSENMLLNQDWGEVKTHPQRIYIVWISR